MTAFRVFRNQTYIAPSLFKITLGMAKTENNIMCKLIIYFHDYVSERIKLKQSKNFKCDNYPMNLGIYTYGCVLVMGMTQFMTRLK